MGGRGRSRTQRKHFKDSRENVWKNSSKSEAPAAAGDVENSGKPNNDGWAPLATHNTAFEDYYKEQKIVAPEEWDDFIETLRKPLPAAFRINASSQFCLDIRTQLEDDFVKSLQTEFIGEDEAEAIRPLPWYPENFAWHSNYSRKQLRKTPTLERFHEFLKLAHEIGNITRQEAVSMVPPLFLDVHPDHYVLDMCAAPGSKTFQLLEIIHRSNKPGFLPSGMVVANDVDVQRSNLLIHQTKRMCTANLMVTNHEAQNFPGCRLSKFNNNPADVESANGLSINQLLFDRVLCDVPCSGDGTLRKAPDIWRRWNSGIGNGLHGLQLKIAMRGISLLKVGGRMVYSTCSMNPVENEAVVAEILRRCGDSVDLLDVSTELPQLVRRPGLKKWKVRDKGLWLSCYKDAPERRRPGLLSSMFPSGKNIDNSSENSGEVHDNSGNRDPKCESEPITNDAVSPSEVSDDGLSNLPLDHCMRIVPHDQNSGAFFIAVFYKRSPLPVQEQSSGVSGSTRRKAREMLEITKNKLDGSASNLDEAKSGETISYARPIDTETNETSLDNEPVQTLKEEVEEQGVGDEDCGPEKTGTKRKPHMLAQLTPKRTKLDGSASNLDEAKSGETISYARPIGTETNETSLDNEPVQTLKEEVEEQGVGDEDCGPEKTGTKRKPHMLAQLTPKRTKLDGSASNLDEAKSGETISYARPIGTETNETSLDNEPVQTLKDEVPEEQGVGDEDSGPEKTGTKRKPHMLAQLTPKRTKLDGSASNLDEAKSGETISYARPIGTETNETFLDNEPVQTLKDEVPEEEGLGDEDSGPEKTGTKRKLHIQGKWKGLDPVLLFNDETVISSIKSFYGIDASFSLHGHLVSRNSDTESVKRIYYISKSLKDVLELNLLAGEQLKIASVGLKMFERQTSKDGNSSNCRYRISSEGLPLLLPFITKQILLASSVDFKRLLEKNSIKFGDFIDPELNENAPKLELGCCVVVLKEDGQALTVPLKVDSSTIAIGCWRGRSNVNVMVSGLDCKDLLERLEMRHKANGISDAVTKEEKEAVTTLEV